MAERTPKYRQLDSDQIVQTVQMLRGRIEARFPGSGLSQVVAELLQIAQETLTRIRWIQKPHVLLRIGAAVLSITMISILGLMVVHIRQFQFNDYTNFIQAFEASISSVVFIGAAIL